MALFKFRWLRRIVRRNTTPIPEYQAYKWQGRLSLMYAFVAWNAFGMVCYMMYTGRRDWAAYYGLKSEDDANLPPGIQWARALGTEKAKIIRFSGLTKTAEIDYVKSESTNVDPAEELPM